MKPKAFEIVKKHLSLVKLLRELEHQLYRIDRVLRGNSWSDDKEYNNAYAIIHAALYKKELDAWRNVAMMALALSPEQQTEVKALAYKRFFDDGYAVMYLTSDLGEIPSSWSSGDEEELRQWLKDNFAPDSTGAGENQGEEGKLSRDKPDGVD